MTPLVELDGYRAFLSEPVDPSTVTPASVTVLWAGPDESFGTGDDTPVAATITLEELDRRIVVGIPTPPIGSLRLRLDGSLIADPSGNLLDGDCLIVFTSPTSELRSFRRCGTSSASTFLGRNSSRTESSRKCSTSADEPIAY